MFESLNARLSVVIVVLAISLAWTMPNFIDTSGSGGQLKISCPMDWTYRGACILS